MGADRLWRAGGLNTGLVLLGEVGAAQEFTAMGNAVNLAARMEQHAPVGGLLIAHDTYRHMRGLFDVRPLDPLAVKGKAEPGQAYLVERAKPRAFRLLMRGVEGVETRMVGRDAELAHLQDALRAVCATRRLRAVTIVVEGGAGDFRAAGTAGRGGEDEYGQSPGQVTGKPSRSVVN